MSVPAWCPDLPPCDTPPTREVTIVCNKGELGISVKDLPWLVEYVRCEILLSRGVHSRQRRTQWSHRAGAWYARAYAPEGEIARKAICVSKRKPDGTLVDEEVYAGKRARARTEIANWVSAVSTGRAPEGSGSPTEP